MIKNTTIKIITSLLLIILFLFAFLIIIVNVFGINIGLILGMDNLYTTENVIGSDTEWTYLPVGEDPGIGKIWTYNDYDDSGWSHGTGPFNWENNGSDDDCPTMFIRTTFEYDDDRIEVNRINCCMSYADAIIVYLNGNVIFAGNVPDGGYKNFLDYGCAYNGEGKRKQVFCVTDLSSLIDGENSLAIEVHVSGHESKGYFDCSYVELSSEEVEEQEPDSSLVVLQAGDDESDVIVSWLSKEADYYQVYYSDKGDKTKNESFLENAEVAYMERRRLTKGYYVHRATLKNLKTYCTYSYAISKIGSTVISRREYFKTHSLGNVNFAVIAGMHNIKTDSSLLNDIPLSAQIIIPGWKTNYINKVYYINQDLANRRNPVLNKISTILIPELDDEYEDTYNVQFCYRNQMNLNAEYNTYQDVLVIKCKNNLDDTEYFSKYISEIVKKTNRKWIIIVMQPSLLPNGQMLNDECKEKWIDILSENEINLVISGEDNSEIGDVTNIYNEKEISVFNMNPNEKDNIFGAYFKITNQVINAEIEMENGEVTTEKIYD